MAEVVSPKLVELPEPPPLTEEEAHAKALKNLDANAWAREIEMRRGDSLRTLSSPLAFVGTHEGWTRRWCNDDGDNIPSRLRDGWRFVNRDEIDMPEGVNQGNGDVGDRVSITTSVGAGPIKTILMEIPTVIAEQILDVRSGTQVRRWRESIERGLTAPVANPARVYLPGEKQGSHLQGIQNGVTQGPLNQGA
jgi:hypothetical protein